MVSAFCGFCSFPMFQYCLHSALIVVVSADFRLARVERVGLFSRPVFKSESLASCSQPNARLTLLAMGMSVFAGSLWVWLLKETNRNLGWGISEN